jgi:hypothetical protein
LCHTLAKGGRARLRPPAGVKFVEFVETRAWDEADDVPLRLTLIPVGCMMEEENSCVELLILLPLPEGGPATLSWEAEGRVAGERSTED